MFSMGQKISHIVGINPWRVSNPCDRGTGHSARRRYNHSATEQGQRLDPFPPIGCCLKKTRIWKD